MRRRYCLLVLLIACVEAAGADPRFERVLGRMKALSGDGCFVLSRESSAGRTGRRRPSTKGFFMAATVSRSKRRRPTPRCPWCPCTLAGSRGSRTARPPLWRCPRPLRSSTSPTTAAPAGRRLRRDGARVEGRRQRSPGADRRAGAPSHRHGDLCGRHPRGRGLARGGRPGRSRDPGPPCRLAAAPGPAAGRRIERGARPLLRRPRRRRHQRLRKRPARVPLGGRRPAGSRFAHCAGARGQRRRRGRGRWRSSGLFDGSGLPPVPDR